MSDALDAAPAHFRGFGPGASAFFRELARNNDRDWFPAHKAEYEREAKGPMMDLVADLGAALSARDLPLHGDPVKALFRIHRDVRFAKDKSPYKTVVSAVLNRQGDKRGQGLLYLQVGAEAAFAAVGFYRLDPAQLAAFRDRIVARRDDWGAVVRALAAAGLAPSTEGALARLPRGYDLAEVADVADALRLKSFIVSRPLTPDELASPNLVDAVADFAAAARPLLDFGWRALGG